MASGRPQIVVSAILEHLDAGAYRIGDLLPAEIELAATHGVSRSTVRTALAELEDLGMIARRRGRGTTVVALRPVAASEGYSHSLGRFEDLVQYADSTRRQVRGMEEVVADFALAERLRCKPGTRWLHVHMIRVSDDTNASAPIAWTDLYAAEAFSQLLRDELPDYPGAAIALVESRHGRQVSEIRQSITATTLSGDVASALDATPGRPCLVITRRYLTAAGVPTMVTFSQHPAQGFSYEMSLKRNGAG